MFDGMKDAGIWPEFIKMKEMVFMPVMHALPVAMGRGPEVMVVVSDEHRSTLTGTCEGHQIVTHDILGQVTGSSCDINLATTHNHSCPSIDNE